MLDIVFLLLTGLLAAYLCWYFWKRYDLNKALHYIYYLMGFAVLLISGLLLIFLGLDILASPYVLTVASLIPLGISMGLAEEYFPKWKTWFKWFAVVGFLAIAITSIGGMDALKKIAVPLFHGVADLFTFGIWEIAGTPIELMESGTDTSLRIIYDQSLGIQRVEIHQQGKINVIDIGNPGGARR